ncbi:uncharacterized protein N7515_005041 [Penicillium bovifimosum]|uniref:Transposase Tc1-like domain-containing protein n=1 Tax=Penicillium bovifimosum TaxID=126998 RepID=A0A9W9H1M9_9EURO|nr:uncharacterized protein N7515_005041 [Penicillium bovifimosum]KAJ5135763.1 hypothetical protein N7515_005041 [Penicillium bovifimosum]
MTPEPPEVPYNYVLDFPSDRLLSPSRHSTADQRKQVHLLHRLGYSVKAISNEVYLTYKCVWYIINQTTATLPSPPTRRAFRNLDFEMIRSYIETSSETRQMPFKKVIRNLELGCSDSTLRRFLKSHGYRRYRAKKKPKLVDRIQPTTQRRKAWMFWGSFSGGSRGPSNPKLLLGVSPVVGWCVILH